MTKNEIKCIDMITTLNASSCMRLYCFLISSNTFQSIYFLFSPCSGTVISGYSKTLTDKLLMTHLAKDIIPLAHLHNYEERQLRKPAYIANEWAEDKKGNTLRFMFIKNMHIIHKVNFPNHSNRKNKDLIQKCGWKIKSFHVSYFHCCLTVYQFDLQGV